METSFKIICLIHIVIWAYILLAFTNKKWALINIYIIIPTIYILHMLPFHILEKMKERIYPRTYLDKKEHFEKTLIIPHFFTKVTTFLEKNCTFNPLSPQGMMLFGFISSLYASTFYHKSLRF